ncbi:vacuolar sorting protein Vps20 [Schizosaccharomyces japonicus yFS275]|uniref:Vacuolar sorting protein Vps20 n=1 Tax=Schizosaccharomyces japonicus (strain yFS275 / FY16936) TaxID=402676 RepID=B6JVK3_SCHJY|nr:vacuolar sorting protein Vps20 [Schizosaccharomyces japonicus yFS275]EEB05404.1 vacuolar sorting protein Vps20 [Schizosaccharomyces japonicus yFS275]
MGIGNSKVSRRDQSILLIKEQRDRLSRYSKRLMRIEQLETSFAKTCLQQGNKQGALHALRAKKLYSSLIEKTSDQLLNLEQLISNIEFSLIEKDVVFGIEQGTNVLQQLHRELPVERVERILLDNESAMDYVEEVNGMIQGQISRADEEDVEAELEQLIAQSIPAHMEQPPALKQTEQKEPKQPTTEAIDLLQEPQLNAPDKTPMSAESEPAQQSIEVQKTPVAAE